MKIKKKAYKNQVTKALYRLIFIKPSYVSFSTKKSLKQNDEKYYHYDKKIINKISAVTIKPFNRSRNKTKENKNGTYVGKLGNKLHNSTSRKHLLNIINLQEGDSLHSELLAEHERIIRSLPYIKDAYFEITTCKDSNLVDIKLVVMDKFSWGLKFKTSSFNSNYFSIQNKNLYGLGHQASLTISYSPEKDKKEGVSLYYYIDNIKQSFINTKIRYENTYKKNDLELDIYRDFIRSNIKYAWGINLHKSFKNKKIEIYEPIFNNMDLAYNKTCIWLARSFLLNKKKRYSIKQFIIGGLYKRLIFLERPMVSAERNRSYHNRDLFLTSISLSNYRYRKANLIYNFNEIEDIPYGYMYKLSLGYEKGEYKNRQYIGLQYSSVNNLSKSKHYLYKKINIGSYICDNKLEQGVVNSELTHVSKLRKINQFRLRNFIGLSHTLGIRRLPEEFISLAEGYGIKGTTKELFYGKQKLILNFENILFTPYTLGGFRFAFYNFIDTGFIGPNDKVIFKQKLYYGAGIGIRIYNANIVFNNFSISFSVYPNAPADFGKYHYKIYNTDHIYFNDFKTSKPLLIEYK